LIPDREKGGVYLLEQQGEGRWRDPRGQSSTYARRRENKWGKNRGRESNTEKSLFSGLKKTHENLRIGSGRSRQEESGGKIITMTRSSICEIAG